MFLVILVDAAGSKDGAVNSLQEAAIGEVHGAYNIRAHGSLLVVLAPVDVWTPRATGGIENMRRLDFVEKLQHGFAILHPYGRGHDVFALALQQRFEVAGDPAVACGARSALAGRGGCDPTYLPR
jgi:hypothetical protein